MGRSSFVTVIIADDQLVYQAGMVKLLSLAGDIDIVACCANSSQLFQAIDASRACVAIVASTLKLEMSHLAERLNRVGSRLIFLVEASEHHLHHTVNGTASLLRRDASVEALIQCVRRAAVRSGDGCVFTHRQMPRPEDQVGTNVCNRLTTKELNILSLVSKGWRNRQIAARLDTTEQVIKNYLRVVFDKAGVSDRLELALFTIHHRALAEATYKACQALGIDSGVPYLSSSPFSSANSRTKRTTAF